MSRPPKVLLIAGEASGDLHGAAFVRALCDRCPGVEVHGIGGDKLRAAGMRILVEAEHIATMGFTETFGTLAKLFRAYRRMIDFMRDERPSLLVIIDFPEFNLLVAKQARRFGVRVLYFIGPQVWAWRRGRARTIAERVDRLALVFPFEPEIYNDLPEARGRHIAEFVGHPLLDTVSVTAARSEVARRYGLDANAPILALLPGSRRSEVAALAPALLGAAQRMAREGWQAVWAAAPGLDPEGLRAALDGGDARFPVGVGDTYNIVAAADAAIVTSGTASLETALLGCPMAIVYRVSGATYWLARALV